MARLNGKAGIVTGASRGIGAAVAEALAGEGAKVALVARSVAASEEVARRIRDRGGEALVIGGDVSDPTDVQRVMVAARGGLGRLDFLVNNAGVIEPIASLRDSDPEVWADNVRINLLGYYYFTREALRVFEGGATIVNVSTGAAQRPLEGWSAYCSAKAGAVMLTRATHLEEGERVAVYGLAPGTVDTDMQVRIRASGINQISRIPREDLGSVDRPARVITWLVAERPEDLRGNELAIGDEDLRKRAGVE